MKAVKFTDGKGETKVRLVIDMEGQYFLLPENVSSEARACQKWFAKAVDSFGKPDVPVKKRKKANGSKKKAAPASKVDLDAIL